MSPEVSRTQILDATPPHEDGVTWGTIGSLLPPRSEDRMHTQITLEERYAINSDRDAIA